MNTEIDILKQASALAEKQCCAHCGEGCEPGTFTHADKEFCCSGCLTVYRIIQENQLGAFYTQATNPGKSQRGLNPKRYDWLEDPEAAQNFIDFQDSTQTHVTLQLPQIHCISCVWLLENLNRLSYKIISSKVNFVKREAYITYLNEAFSLKDLADLLTGIGYAPDFTSFREKGRKVPINRRLNYQVGLAGFAFGNIMLFSFPEYLGLEYNEGSVFRLVFGWLNLLLAIPVLLYSGQDYLRSAYHGLRKGNLSIDVPVALGMITLFARSFIEVLSKTGAGYFDSLAGLVFFLLIGKWFQQKTFKHLSFERDYESYFPVAASVITGGKEKSVCLANLEVGNELLIRHGELIPADGVLLSETASVDYSFVTGESVPEEKTEGDLIYAGGRQTASAVRMVITKKPSQSYLIRLWNNEDFKETKQSTRLLADKTGEYFTYLILIVAIISLVYWLSRGNPATAVNAFTAVLIIACPCAVALAAPFTFGTASRLAAKAGVYFKDIHLIEQLKDINAVVFDKTGTLTSRRQEKLQYQGEALSTPLLEAVYALSKQSGHPLSRKIRAWAEDYISFGSESEIYGFRETLGQGIQGEYQGLFIKLGNRKFLGENKVPALHKYATVFLSINGKLLGSFTLRNVFRKGLEDFSKWAKNKGEVYLLSGDNSREKQNLQSYFNKENLLFSQSPYDKLSFIKSLQNKGKKVMMVGDGLNDSGALKRSEIGLVITEDTNNFVPACDIIADAKSFAKLPKLFDYLSKNVALVQAAYLLALSYNIIGLSYAVSGTLSPVVAAILMPLSSISVVLFGVLGSRLLFYRTVERER